MLDIEWNELISFYLINYLLAEMVDVVNITIK